MCYTLSVAKSNRERSITGSGIGQSIIKKKDNGAFRILRNKVHSTPIVGLSFGPMSRPDPLALVEIIPGMLKLRRVNFGVKLETYGSTR